MREQKIGVADCPGWVLARCYEAVARNSMGDFEGAMELAREISGVPLGQGRLRAQGKVLLLWEGKTLPARLYMARGREGDAEEMVKSLPAKETVKPLINKTLAVYYYEGLRQYAMTRWALGRKDFEVSQEYLQATAHTYMQMNARQRNAVSSPEFGAWVRAKSALAAMIPELQGLSVLARGKGIESAFNWFRSAVSKQQRGKPPDASRHPLPAGKPPRRIPGSARDAGRGEQGIRPRP